jgi:hypothetical protein
MSRRGSCAISAPARDRISVKPSLNPYIGCAALLLVLSWPALSDDAPAQTPAPGAVLPPPPAPSGWKRWFNPATAPFIPVPEIAVNPNAGTTLGLIPTWIQTDDQHEVRRIIAPDVLYNPYFGFGMHFRDYVYSSQDQQWSVVAGIKERVERDFDAEYQSGRARLQLWSITASLISDRSGTPRFYGIGNETQESAQSTYINQQQKAQVQIGLNITHAWQLLYTARELIVDVLPGTMPGIPTIQSLYGQILGVGTTDQNLNRLSVVYDTRDDLTVPSRGMELVAYGGLAARSGIFNDSSFSELGFDGRNFWPLSANMVLAAHTALHYLPTAHEVPFWALSNVGGGESDLGGAQPLRGFETGRFYDRDSFDTTLELRRKVFSFDATSTIVDIEMAPFIDVGRVFSRSGTDFLEQLHKVYGVGFRGIARPFVVGYVDIGYGSEGVAVFTGLNYPF